MKYKTYLKEEQVNSIKLKEMVLREFIIRQDIARVAVGEATVVREFISNELV